MNSRWRYSVQKVHMDMSMTSAATSARLSFSSSQSTRSRMQLSRSSVFEP